jgi:mono/diheme cytochrome c family protein
MTPPRLVPFIAWALCTCCTLCSCCTSAAEPPIDFGRDVASIFEQHCLHCHSDNISKGDVSLSTIESLQENEYVVPGDPDNSHLVDLISGDDPQMPSEGDPLSAEEVAVIRSWITNGAEWPSDVILHEKSKGDESWWSLQPLADFDASASIDSFIEAKLSENGLAMNPAADRRALIRRATYDLTGLPPTPEEIDAFLNNPDSAAYENLIDRLLSSPRYGERWGRHWLDVVRFGESNGFERNVIIDNLWPFRDYVIRSLNEDKPFDQLIREHLAGDVIGPGDPDIEVGSAFLVAGPYDNVGNQDAAAKAQIRANTIDEMIRATGEAFLGLTVGCARCHDHKFDSILQSDYYQLYATLSGVRHGSRIVATEEERTSRQAVVHPLAMRKDELTSQRDTLNNAVNERAKQNAPQHELAWTRQAVDRTGTEDHFDPVEARFVRLIAEGTDTNPKAGRGFRIDEFEVWSSEPEPRNVALASNGAVATGASRVIEDFPGAYGPQLAIDAKVGARFISTDVELKIELAQPTSIDRVVFSSARGELKPDQPKFVFVSDYRIESSLDGQTWEVLASGRDRKPANQAHRQHRLFELEITADERKKTAKLSREINGLTRQINAVAPLRTMWVGDRVAADAKGPFHVFIGGSPQRKGIGVVPASVSTLSNVTPAYKLGEDSSEADRRVALADWIVHEDNPLTPRVLANRLWHYHFGTGIVSTPSDFGFMGGRPSHAALLDWLAAKLVDGSWRLKPLHKAIMMSRTYRQSSDFSEQAARIDGDDRLLWRFPPRRLSAEEIRDTMLSVSGSLNTKMGGPGFRLYRYLQDNVATYVPLDKHGAGTYRRAVYHQNARAARTDLMTDFDQPDCAFSTPRRAETTTPLQALTTLNHTFTLDMARAMADRLERDAGEDQASQVQRLFQLCLGREPTGNESRDCRELIREFGLNALCRILLNTSELIYVL